MPETKLVWAETGEECPVGAKLEDETIESPYTVTGHRAPHKPSSSGRVYVRTSTGHDREFFPHVFDLKIVNADED